MTRAVASVRSGRAALAATALRVGEHEHTAAVVAWARALAGLPEGFALRLLYAVPNGGARHPRTAGRLWAEGVRTGVADLVLPIARRGFHACYLEMKAADRSARLSPSQRDFLVAVASEGAYAAVAWGVDAGILALATYLGLRPPEGVQAQTRIVDGVAHWTPAGWA